MSVADEARDVRFRPATPDLADKNFRAFIESVSAHVRSVVCTGVGTADVQLLFIKRPLVKQSGTAIEHLSAADKYAGPNVRGLNSPWLYVKVSGHTVRRIHAIFTWNERQLLRDQAVMAGVSLSGQSPPVSIDPAVLAQYSATYVQRTFHTPDERSGAGLGTTMPPEVLWLYRHAVQSTFGDFSIFATAALDSILGKARQGYTDIAIALFDRSLGFRDGIKANYTSVLDVRQIVDLASYRVN